MRREGGFVLPLLMIMLMIGALVFGLDTGRIDRAFAVARIEHARDSLARVADALGGYAASYPQTHVTNPRYGLLPCPDINGDGSADLSCGNGDTFAIGRIPYRTLGIEPPEDGSGSCLWYAVAAAYKSNPGPAGELNWDTVGQFELSGPAGEAVIRDGAPHSLAVAVLLAPGPPLAAQSRNGSAYPCRSPITAGTQAQFLESLATASPSAVQRFNQGLADGSVNNDLLAWIAPDDIYRRLLRSSYFELFLNQRLDEVAIALATTALAPENSDGRGPVAVGGLPEGDQLGISGAAAIAHDDWRPMFRYLRCRDDSPCQSVNGQPCRIVLAFGGARTAGQTRATEGQRADPDQYFEGANRDAMHLPSLGFNGPPQIDLKQPTLDVFRCIA